MKQIHFQSKTHIIGWLMSNCPRKAIVRALNEGRVEFFGGFNLIPPTTQPGWVMRVTSIYGKIWYVAVIAHRDHYGIRILRDVPWRYWLGASIIQRGPWTSLFNGDNPGEYLELRRIWNECHS